MDIAKIRKKLKKSEIKETPETADKKSEIIREEAKELGVSGKAESPDASAETHPVETTEILAFKVANEEYAVRITELQEVIRYQKITAVPRSPRYLKGITSLRGKILPIIDLKERLGLAGKEGEKQKIIVLSGKKEPLGALVNAVLGVLRFPASELLPPPSTLTEEERNFIEGVVRINNKFISILKVDEILKTEAL